MIKHSCPDIANSVRELTKVLDRATQYAFKEMKRIMKFVLDTKNKGLKLEPTNDSKWSMEMFLDSEYGGDKDTRISVGGFILFLLNVPVLWRSKAQR